MKMVKVGVAIPAHGPKLHLLSRCLDSIEQQSRKPDLVAISASETTCIGIDFADYSFSVRLAQVPHRQNAATNRNVAARLLGNDVDVIHFFDCDDEMLPQCLEFLERTFVETESVMVVHNFVHLKSAQDAKSPQYTEFRCFPKAVVPYPGWCGCKVECDGPTRQFAHGHVAVRREIWARHPFAEDANHEQWEDAAFCRHIAKLYDACAYISTQLSIYHNYAAPVAQQCATVCVTLCDANYWPKAKRTIVDLRSVGEWRGDVVLIAVGGSGFVPNATFCDFYRVQVKRFDAIDTDALVAKIRAHPFTDSDGREYNKLAQWEKLHVFDTYFAKWNRVVFFDAGLRVLDRLHGSFLRLDWTGRFLCHDDSASRVPKPFGCQIEQQSHPEALATLTAEFGADCLEHPYFLNCMWIYDTALLATFSKAELIDVMNRFPVCRTNEMGVMNLVIQFRHGLWTPFPVRAPNGKFLFEWSDVNHHGTTWRNYCALKYPISINFDCE